LKLVFVVGNVHPGTGVSDQDIKLRDALSDSLASHLHDSRLIDGAAIRKFLKDNRISPDMLYSPSLADLIAIHGRADAFVALAIRYLDSGLLRLTAELHAKEKNFESVGEFSCEVALSDLQTKVSGNPSSTSLNKTAPYAGTNGLTGIECLYCPGPSFPPKARRKGVKGQVMVLTEVIVNPDGRAYDIRLISSAGFGFDAEAVEAILRWRFKPAQVGGQPIAAITQIQILFQ
jgi:TonB family protein